MIYYNWPFKSKKNTIFGIDDFIKGRAAYKKCSDEKFFSIAKKIRDFALLNFLIFVFIHVDSYKFGGKFIYFLQPLFNVEQSVVDSSATIIFILALMLLGIPLLEIINELNDAFKYQIWAIDDLYAADS